MKTFIYKLNCKALAIATIIALFLSLCLASCSSVNNERKETVSFTDALGRQVSIPKNPKRVASLLGSFSDVWLLAGGELCASASDAWEDFGLSLDNVINIGGAHSPSLELLFSSSPDLVIASASTKSHTEMKDVLTSAGIDVIYFDVDDFYEYLHMLDVCTDLTERKDLYEANGLALKSRIDMIKTEFKNSNLSEKERTVLLLRASSSSVKAKSSRGTILGEILGDIGCINIADSESHLLENLSVESVITKNPYRIFVVTMGNDEESAKASVEKLIKENPAWNTLEAVRQNRIHVMDKKLFNLKPNANFARAYEVIYEIITKN